MAEFKCPLCKQTVSEELFDRITGIWRERRIAEKKLKEQGKELIKQQKELKNKFEAERKKLKSEQKVVIEQKLAEKSKKFDAQLQKLEKEKNAIKNQFDKKVAVAVKSAEARAKREVNSLLKEKMQESIKAQVEKATLKTQEGLLRATRTIEATKKQMSTLQQNNLKQQQQNLKQQDRIKNLEIQLQNQTTPQLEGLLYEDKLIEALQKDFPDDKFVHTGKGGDILHHVTLQKNEVGLIVYECKRVGHWQSAHAEQAYTAKIQRKADYAVLVTNAAKKGAGGFFIEKGVIVVSPGGILALAAILREQIIQIAQLKLTKSQREEAIEKTMEYLHGAEFKNSLELVIRKTVEMYEDLKKECHDHVKGWKKRYESLKSVYTNTVQVQGKTTALISGKHDPSKEVLAVQPFPALPDLTEA